MTSASEGGDGRRAPRPSAASRELEILELLVAAAATRSAVSPGRGWTYGWFDAAYRHSPNAGIGVAGGQVHLAPDGIAAFERAMQLLLSGSLARQWDQDEIWGVVAAAVASAPGGATPDRAWLSTALADISAQGSVVLLPVSNVAWAGPPTRIGNCVLGAFGPEWVDAAGALSPGLGDTLRHPEAPTWPPYTLGPERVTLAARVPFRGDRAIAAAEALLADLVALPLIATVDLDALKIWSLRGDSHRPGVRGLRLHRPALEQATSKAIHAELAAEILVVDSAHARKSVHWHGEDPFPLERLLELDDGLTARTLGIDDALSNRLRTAARWHAESHWSSDAADAVLALGVAFDALLAEPGGGPGRVIIERRALLEPRLDQRADRARTMREIYEARSSVAHGGRSSKLSESGFLRSVSRELRITARQLVALGVVTRLGSEKDVAAAFEDLRWGTLRINTPAPTTSDQQPETS